MSSKVSISERLASIRNFFTSGKAFSKSVRTNAIRWFDRLLLGLTAALCFYLLVRNYNSFFLSLPLWLLLSLAVINGWVLQQIQSVFSVRLRREGLDTTNPLNISATLSYPPLFFSAVVAVVALWFAISNEVFLIPNQSSTLLLFTLIGSYTITVIMNSDKASGNETPEVETLNLNSCDEKDFEKWITDDLPSSKLDFYNRQPYVDRMTARIVASSKAETKNQRQVTKEIKPGQRGQILFGEFGTGKTTLIKLVEKKVRQQEPDKWITSYFDCWAHGDDPQQLIKLLLEQVVSDIGKRVEAVSLHSVPDDYLEVAYGVSSWIKLITPFLPKHNPHTVLKRIDTLLEAQDLKLLLVIENIDRSPAVVALVNSVASVLDQVSQFESIRFIFTGSREKLPLPAVARIADYTEVLANNLSPLVIGQFLKFCLDYSLNTEREKRPVVIPWLEKDFVPESASNVLRYFELEREVNELYASLHSKGTNEQLLDALTNCLANPRQLKLVFRYVSERWQNLEGEVNLIDLLLYGTAIHDGEILGVLGKYKEDLPKSGTPEDPFFIGKKEEGTIERDRVKRRQKENEESEYPGDHYQQTIAYYLADGHRDMYETMSIQRIRITKAANQNKYTMIANSGSILGYPSDQKFISCLNQIAEGSQTAFAGLIGDSTLDLKADYIDELLEGLKKNHWQSSQPLLPIVAAAIKYKGNTKSIRYKEFFNKILGSLINQPAVLPKSLLRPDEIEDFTANHIRKAHEVIACSLNDLYRDGQYSHLLYVMFRATLLCPLNDRKVIIEPLIRTYYTKEVARHWAQINQETGNEFNAIYYYFEVGLEATDRSQLSNRTENNLATVVCEALLYVIHLNTNSEGSSLEKFFDKYEHNNKLQLGLLTRANKTEVKSGMSSTALKALKALQATYGEEILNE
ncbi:AAA family ATPase [Bacterioplanoides sp.]|uniref:AAA family ATPase n=1 Tax=Bacterioplanoides sp. TaxID=2066072 RepID=UPI003B5C2FDD